MKYNNIYIETLLNFYQFEFEHLNSYPKIFYRFLLKYQFAENEAKHYNFVNFFFFFSVNLFEKYEITKV